MRNGSNWDGALEYLSLVFNQYRTIYDINLYQANHSTKKLTQKDLYTVKSFVEELQTVMNILRQSLTG